MDGRKDKWVDGWVSRLEYECILSSFHVLAHQGFCLFFHPIFYKNIVSDYVSSSPLTVGMTTNSAPSLSSYRQVICQGPGE